MKRWLLLLAMGCVALSAASQTVTVTAARFGGIAPATGTLYFAPVDNNGRSLSYQLGGGGQSLITPIAMLATRGVVSGTLPDTGLTSPRNLCFRLTFLPQSGGQQSLGPGYSCLQPTASNSWCSAGVCNLDNYIPSTPALAPVQPYVSSVNGQSGAETLQSSGNTIAFTYPDATHINLEASGTAPLASISGFSNSAFCSTIEQQGARALLSCENFTYWLDTTVGAGGLTITREYTGDWGRCAAKYAVDSVNGSDANPGTCASPWKTLAKLATVTNVEGDSIGFAAGSHWREAFTPTSGISQLTLSAYGSGTRPEMDGYAAISNGSFTKTGGYTNVYQVTLTILSAGGGGPSINIDEGGTYMPQGAQSSIANVDSTAGSYYYSQAGCTSTGTCTVYIHTGDGSSPITDSHIFEYTGARTAAVLNLNGANNFTGPSGTSASSEIRGLWIRGGQLLAGYGNFVHDLLMTEGLQHTIYTLENDRFQNIVLDGAYDSVNTTNMGGPLPIINFFNPTGGTLTFDGVVIKMPSTPIANQSSQCAAMFGHVPGGGGVLSFTFINQLIVDSCSGPALTLGTTDYVNGIFLFGTQDSNAGVGTGVAINTYDPTAYISGVVEPSASANGPATVITLSGDGGNYSVSNSWAALTPTSGSVESSLIGLQANLSSLTLSGDSILQGDAYVGSVSTGGHLIYDLSHALNIGTLTIDGSYTNIPLSAFFLNSSTVTAVNSGLATPNQFYNFNFYGGSKGQVVANIGGTQYALPDWKAISGTHDPNSGPTITFNANWGAFGGPYDVVWSQPTPTDQRGCITVNAGGAGGASGATINYIFGKPILGIPIVSITPSTGGGTTWAAPTTTSTSFTLTTTNTPVYGTVVCYRVDE